MMPTSACTNRLQKSGYYKPIIACTLLGMWHVHSKSETTTLRTWFVRTNAIEQARNAAAKHTLSNAGYCVSKAPLGPALLQFYNGIHNFYNDSTTSCATNSTTKSLLHTPLHFYDQLNHTPPSLVSNAVQSIANSFYPPHHTLTNPLSTHPHSLHPNKSPHYTLIPYIPMNSPDSSHPTSTFLSSRSR